jgi:hypothetical protein
LIENFLIERSKPPIKIIGHRTEVGVQRYGRRGGSGAKEASWSEEEDVHN